MRSIDNVITKGIPEAETIRSASLLKGATCDRCGARAWVAWRVRSGGDLVFCRHHAGRYGNALEEAGGTMLEDERGHLEALEAGFTG